MVGGSLKSKQLSGGGCTMRNGKTMGKLALLSLASVFPSGLSLHAPPALDQGAADGGGEIHAHLSGASGIHRAALPQAASLRGHGLLVHRLRGGLVGGHVPRLAGSDCSGWDDSEQEEGKWRPMCRICYDEEPEGLFTPCKCSGSMRYVHKECLRHWRAVNVCERAFTHCTMCAAEYKLSDSASSGPPDTWTYRVARSLATNECAVTATMLSLAVTLVGESFENSGLGEALVRRFPALLWVRFGPSPTPRRPGPWIPGKAPRADGGLWGWSGGLAGGSGTPATVTPIDGTPQSAWGFSEIEESVLGRLRCYWACLSVGSLLAVSALAIISASGVQVWQAFATFVETEAEVNLAVASVVVWWVVYTCCEVVFVHLHHYPRALFWTALLYLAEGIVSIPLQFGIQLYVSAVEQPSLSDIVSVEQDTTD